MQKVVFIGDSSKMYGGMCINITCIPTKVLIESTKEYLSFIDVVEGKNSVV